MFGMEHARRFSGVIMACCTWKWKQAYRYDYNQSTLHTSAQKHILKLMHVTETIPDVTTGNHLVQLSISYLLHISNKARMIA